MHSVQRGMAAVTFRKRSRNLDSRPEEARVRLDRVWPGVTPLLELSFGRELKVARKSHFFWPQRDRAPTINGVSTAHGERPLLAKFARILTGVVLKADEKMM